MPVTPAHPQQKQHRHFPSTDRTEYGVDSVGELGDITTAPPDPLNLTDSLDPTDSSLAPEEPLPKSLQWGTANECPWRKRARRDRVTVASVEEGGVVEHGDLLDDNHFVGGESQSPAVVRSRRAVERIDVREIRKQNANRMRQDSAAQILDLVGVTAPLIVIIGVAMVQNIH